jgi:hypothetical protein
MLDRALADLTIAAHFAFLVFVVAGGLLARRWRWLAAPHLLAAAWGVYIEVANGVCPLTRIENRYARRAGRAGYEESFIEHHLMPVIYPAGLTRPMQWGIAGFVVGVNALVYAWPRRRALGGLEVGGEDPR